MKVFALSAAALLAVAACATASVEAQPETQPSGATHSELKAYPEAKAGQTRHVIELPALPNEDGMKVELIAGQTQIIDCNQHVLGGELKEETVQGWGYTYHILPEVRGGASTMMGCAPGSDREAFVTLPSQTLIRYNSRLPVVVYTPDTVDLRYRLWSAQEVRSVK